MLDNFHTTMDIWIEGSGQGIKIQKDKYMPFVMKMVMIWQVHYLRTKMVEKKQKIVPKSTPTDTTQTSTIQISDVNDYCMVSTFFSVVAKMYVTKMTETEKRASRILGVCAILWEGKFNIRWQHPIFNFIMHAVQFCKEDCTILQICWAVEPMVFPSTKQIFPYFFHFIRMSYDHILL